jgi:allantoinase
VFAVRRVPRRVEEGSQTMTTPIRDRVRYLPSVDRPRLSWPNGERVAIWVSPNIEHYEFLPPHSDYRNPWPRVPHPDVQGFGQREYGNRVGLWRMAEVLDSHDIRCTVSLNLAVLDHFPEVRDAIVDRNWAVMSHGVYNTRYLYGMDAEEERQFYFDTASTLYRHTGLVLKGMLGPAITANYETPDLMAEAGLTWSTDWYHDDRPVPLRVRSGRLISIPYSLDLNDVGFFGRGGTAETFVQMCKSQFHVLYEEGADSAVVMCIALHPFVTGQPHLVGALDEIFSYLKSFDGVWWTTGDEIAEHYLEHGYEADRSHVPKLRGVGGLGPIGGDRPW